MRGTGNCLKGVFGQTEKVWEIGGKSGRGCAGLQGGTCIFRHILQFLSTCWLFTSSTSSLIASSSLLLLCYMFLCSTLEIHFIFTCSLIFSLIGISLVRPPEFLVEFFLEFLHIPSPFQTVKKYMYRSLHSSFKCSCTVFRSRRHCVSTSYIVGF